MNSYMLHSPHAIQQLASLEFNMPRCCWVIGVFQKYNHLQEISLLNSFHSNNTILYLENYQNSSISFQWRKIIYHNDPQLATDWGRSLTIGLLRTFKRVLWFQFLCLIPSFLTDYGPCSFLPLCLYPQGTRHIFYSLPPSTLPFVSQQLARRILSLESWWPHPAWESGRPPLVSLLPFISVPSHFPVAPPPLLEYSTNLHGRLSCPPSYRSSLPPPPWPPSF